MFEGRVVTLLSFLEASPCVPDFGVMLFWAGVYGPSLLWVGRALLSSTRGFHLSAVTRRNGRFSFSQDDIRGRDGWGLHSTPADRLMDLARKRKNMIFSHFQNIKASVMNWRHVTCSDSSGCSGARRRDPAPPPRLGGRAVGLGAVERQPRWLPRLPGGQL